MAKGCEICGAPLVGRGPRALTCSDAHAKQRQRNLRKSAAERRQLNASRDTIDNVVQEVIKEEIRPVIREALTESVLRSIGDMVELVPDTVRAMQEDINQSDNAFLRQHAYQTLLKYTVGSKALVPDLDEGNAPMTVIINGIERPADGSFQAGVADSLSQMPIDGQLVGIGDDEGWKVCDSCGNAKPDDQFVGNSERCVMCFERFREQAEQKLSNGG